MAAKKVLRFKIGDWIVHYYHGVGEVVDIVEKGLEGHQETYFKVATKQIEYWIPINKADAEYIEPIRSEKEFDQAILIVSQPPRLIAETHTRTKKLIYERWLDGSLPARAALIRDLHGRDKLKKLSYNEKEIFEKVERFFISEWIISNPSLTLSMARQKLSKALDMSSRRANRALEPIV